MNTTIADPNALQRADTSKTAVSIVHR